MKILLTGGSGDLGQVLAKRLTARGDAPICLDVRAPLDPRGVFVQGSILDRALLEQTFKDVECIIHIAAWHGLHEVRGEKDAYEFWDVNVTGTLNVFEAAVRSGVDKVVFISSTSVDEWPSMYGFTKVAAEEIARRYAAQHHLNVITLRPRAFIPHWNKVAYQNFVDWAKWFWSGAVHIDDVAQAVERSIGLLKTAQLEQHLVLTVDGAYDYSDADLIEWDEDGPGSTFRKYYPQYYDLAVRYGLNPAEKPEKKDISHTRRWLGYEPQYSLKNLLAELKQYGLDGPPPPEH